MGVDSGVSGILSQTFKAIRNSAAGICKPMDGIGGALSQQLVSLPAEMAVRWAWLRMSNSVKRQS